MKETVSLTVRRGATGSAAKASRFNLFFVFVEGQSSQLLYFNCWIQKACAAFALLMSCNAVNHGPGLRHLRDLERHLAGRSNLADHEQAWP